MKRSKWTATKTGSFGKCRKLCSLANLIVDVCHRLVREKSSSPAQSFKHKVRLLLAPVTVTVVLTLPAALLKISSP